MSCKNVYLCKKNVILRVWLDRGRQCRHFAPRTLSKSLFVFSDLSRMCFFTYFLAFSISWVPSRSNHYLEKIGGMYAILIGTSTLNAPNGPP